jgi:hypothetical protein
LTSGANANLATGFPQVALDPEDADEAGGLANDLAATAGLMESPRNGDDSKA